MDRNMYEYIDNFLYSCKKRQRHQNCKWKLTHTHTSIHRCIFIPLHVYITHARIELMAAQWAAKIVIVQLLCCTYFLFFSAVVAHKVTRLSHVKSHSTCSYCFCLSHNIGPALSGMKPWPKRVASSNFIVKTIKIHLRGSGVNSGSTTTGLRRGSSFGCSLSRSFLLLLLLCGLGDMRLDQLHKLLAILD